MLRIMSARQMVPVGAAAAALLILSACGTQATPPRSSTDGVAVAGTLGPGPEGEPANVIEVAGQRWTWTFNYGIGHLTRREEALSPTELDAQVRTFWRALIQAPGEPPSPFDYTQYAYDVGDASRLPLLVLPAGVISRIYLHSFDAVHGFHIALLSVTADAVPGRVNHVDARPTTITAVFEPTSDNFLDPVNGYSNDPTASNFYLASGNCVVLCGAFHSRMLFRMAVLSPADYTAYVAAVASHNKSPHPLLPAGPAVSGSG